MLQIIGCLVATTMVALATFVAGRAAGVSLTALACGSMAFFMTPTFSLRVAHPADIATLVVQSIAGIVVTRIARRKGSPLLQATAVTLTAPASPRRGRRCSLVGEVLAGLLEQHSELRLRSAEIRVQVDQLQEIELSELEFDWVVASVLSHALARHNVRSVSIYAARQPSCDRISVSADYGHESALPKLRMVGRPAEQCKHFQTSAWPARCSATWFDNGFEYIYQIKVQKPESA